MSYLLEMGQMMDLVPRDLLQDPVHFSWGSAPNPGSSLAGTPAPRSAPRFALPHVCDWSRAAFSRGLSVQTARKKTTIHHHVGLCPTPRLVARGDPCAPLRSSLRAPARLRL